MFEQPRKSSLLNVLEGLRKRKKLKHEDRVMFQRLSKRYDGEVVFSNLLSK